jgi:hypothetical protein
MRGICLPAAILVSLVFMAGCTVGPGYGQPPPTSGVFATPPVAVTTFPTLPATTPENISANWAGYVVQTSFDYPETGAVEAVEAIWSIPTVDCSQTGMSDYSSAFWVGIDGYSSVSVEQIGTDSDCVRGAPVYYAWYEVYPRNSVNLDMTLLPGDEIHATVAYVGDQQFRFSLTDHTSNQTVSTTETSATAKRSSAEWIAEAPVYHHRILPLSDFGPVDFINASVTVKGVTGSIMNDQWDYRSIVMEAVDGTVKATPTGLVNGNSFSIIWEHT